MVVSEEVHDRSQSGSVQPRDPRVLIVRNRPSKIVAVDAIELIGNYDRVIIKARGNSIPNAVNVANIVTGRMLKGTSTIEAVMVDSIEPHGMGRLISTIEIVLAKSRPTAV